MGVEREQVRLLGDARDGLDDAADLGGRRPEPAEGVGGRARRLDDQVSRDVVELGNKVRDTERDTERMIVLLTLVIALLGMIAALVAAYKGLNAKGGPKGVGDAVNQSVVISFMLLFLVNFIITAIYFQVVPQKGG